MGGWLRTQHSILKHPTLNFLEALFLLDLLLLQLLTDNHHPSQGLGAARRKEGPGLIIETPGEFMLDPPRPLSLILHQHPVAAFRIHFPKQDVAKHQTRASAQGARV